MRLFKTLLQNMLRGNKLQLVASQFCRQRYLHSLKRVCFGALKKWFCSVVVLSEKMNKFSQLHLLFKVVKAFGRNVELGRKQSKKARDHWRK